MATPAPWGNPFGVSTTKGRQANMKVAAFVDGSFVAVWQDSSGEGEDPNAIRGQLFNADGSKRGGEFIVNSTPEGDQYEPTVTVLADGRFVVAWTDLSETDDPSSAGIRARIFSADGTAFNRTGAPGGDADFQVNGTMKDGLQEKQSVAALANGGFVITFRDMQTGYAYAQVFDAQGFHAGAEVAVQQTYGITTVIASADGYRVFNVSDFKIYGRTFYNDGREPSAEFLISNPDTLASDLNVTSLSDSRYVVTWVAMVFPEGASRPSFSNKAQIYNSDGSKFSVEISISGSDTAFQYINGATALPNGGFAVSLVSTMKSEPSVDDLFDVGMISFDANGNKTGTNMKLGQISGRNLESVDISTLADGRVIITWDTSDGTDGANVRGQIVDGRAAGITLPGTSNNDEYYGSTFNDHLNGAAGNDKLVGGNGNDTLIGGTGVDTLDGGAGDDTYTYDVEDIILDAGGNDTLIVASHYTLSNTSALENLTASGTAAIKLTGNNAANALTGNAGADTLTGNGGNDTLDGAGGADRMEGGKGNDVYYVNHKSDKVIEAKSGGTDTVHSRISYTLGTHVEKLIGDGASAINLTGNEASNTIIGNAGKNTIKGNGGNDVIDGGLGNDVLYGGTGKDAFVFSTALHKSKNVDTLKDFSVRDDTIRLDNAIFTKLTKTGKLNKSFFKIGTKAGDKNDFIVYNDKTGALFYDADGSGKKAGLIKIAQLPKNLEMTAADFLVI
ncbi:hypothetical protein MHY87_06245 [Microvirga sp. ACRRW]|uniref:calcium-binding protein n=1 Tax=Microvirga sp. ACRRW TaxID=2918205 RepID=UPI001EF54177|nr:calcium-binding protein [Microvirga sp. ACRRW]MCG7392501.1 hypothetical protein [Microvirga sp. ACRRW]